MDFSKIIDWIKLSPKYLFAIIGITSFLLFAPTRVLASLGLISIVTQYRAIVGGLFLVSGVLFLVHLLVMLYELISTRVMTTMVARSRQDDLFELTEGEKKILRGYIYDKTQTQYFSPFDGVTAGLVAKGIIYRATTIGYTHQFSYNIQPWAWKYLNIHPELLDPSSELDRR